MPGQEIIQPPSDRKYCPFCGADTIKTEHGYQCTVCGDQSKHDISEYVNVLNRKVEELASRYTQQKEDLISRLKKENTELRELLQIKKVDHGAALRASQMYKNELANIAIVAGKRDISDDEFRAWAKSRTTYLVRNWVPNEV